MLSLTLMKAGDSSLRRKSSRRCSIADRSLSWKSSMRKLPLLLLLLAGAAGAQDAPPPELQPAPDGPPAAPADEGPVVPEITIRRTETGVTREFRYGGVLYMVEIIPSAGPSYFLVDTDGDGSLETRYRDLDPNIAIPAWVLLRW